MDESEPEFVPDVEGEISEFDEEGESLSLDEGCTVTGGVIWVTGELLTPCYIRIFEEKMTRLRFNVPCVY